MEKNFDVRYEMNNEKNGIELFFNEKPSESLREELKQNRWRWNSVKKCWFNKANGDNELFAIKICSRKIDFDAAVLKEEKVSQKKSLNENKKYVERSTISNIWTIDRKKGKKLELGISIGKEEEYDLRVWKDDKGYHDNGIKLSYDELFSMTEALKNYRASCKSNSKPQFGRGDIIFQNDIFKTVYLGVENEDSVYKLWFETENLSEYLISVEIDKIFICDCEVSPVGRLIAYNLQPHKKIIDYIELFKRDLKRYWIKKIWEYTEIEADLSMAYHISVRNKDFRDYEYNFMTKISLRPDKYI